MMSGRRSSLIALMMNAKLADKTNRAATCVVIFAKSFMLICEPRERRRGRLRILALQYI